MWARSQAGCPYLAWSVEPVMLGSCPKLRAIARIHLMGPSDAVQPVQDCQPRAEPVSAVGRH